ncbi:MAG: encapsulin-associated ferritin-like protein [Spirochaetaceae bacterium]
MSSQYHEPPEELSPRIRDLTRILVSLKEEIEAIDWYNQRIELASDDQVRSILRHNQMEEMEHASMALEYLRRNMEGWDETLRTYLFSEGDITALEEEAEGHGHQGGQGRGEASGGGLGIGSLRGDR